MAIVSFMLLIPPLECLLGDLSSMSAAEQAVDQPPLKRQRKPRQVFADTIFPGSYDPKPNNEAGQNILKAAQGQKPKTPKKPAGGKTKVSY